LEGKILPEGCINRPIVRSCWYGADFPSVVSSSRGAYLNWIHQCYSVPRRVQLCIFNQLVAIKL